MDLKKSILDWLESGGRFAVGVELLTATNHPAAQKYQQLLHFPLAHITARKDLVLVLQSLADRLPDQSTSEPAPVARQQPAAEPEAIQRLRSKAKRLHKEQDQLHGRMVQLATQPDSPERKAALFDLAYQMMEFVSPELTETYAAIRNWQDTGELPAENTGELAQAARIIQARNTARTSASKWRKKLNAATDPEDQARYQVKIDEVEALIKELEAKLRI